MARLATWGDDATWGDGGSCSAYDCMHARATLARHTPSEGAAKMLPMALSAWLREPAADCSAHGWSRPRKSNEAHAAHRRAQREFGHHNEAPVGNSLKRSGKSDPMDVDIGACDRIERPLVTGSAAMMGPTPGPTDKQRYPQAGRAWMEPKFAQPREGSLRRACMHNRFTTRSIFTYISPWRMALGALLSTAVRLSWPCRRLAPLRRMSDGADKGVDKRRDFTGRGW